MKWLGVTVLCLGLTLSAQAPRTSRRAGPPPKPQNTTGLTCWTRVTTESGWVPCQPAAPAPETARPPIQEIFPTGGFAELKRLQASAARKRDVRKVLYQIGSRRLNASEKEKVSRIRSFLQLSDDAEGKKDMWTADALAERAQGLVGELQSERSGRSALLPNVWK